MKSIEYENFKDTVEPEEKILIMFSGGIDSVAVLYLLLKDTECPIHVHHIAFDNAERRWEAEQIAVRDTLKYLTEKYRQVEYTESTYTFGDERWFGYDTQVVGFIASQIIQGERQKIRYLATGRCADDVEYHRSTHGAKGNIQENIITAALGNKTPNHPINPTVIRPVLNLRKPEIIKLMPDELVQLTWSCRRPKRTETGFVRCERCAACRKMKKRNVWDVTPNSAD